MHGVLRIAKSCPGKVIVGQNVVIVPNFVPWLWADFPKISSLLTVYTGAAGLEAITIL